LAGSTSQLTTQALNGNVRSIRQPKPNIAANAVAPGVIATEMFDRFAGDELRDQIAAITPVGRVGAAEEIAAAILYLASDAARFATGTSLVVDGGYIAA